MLEITRDSAYIADIISKKKNQEADINNHPYCLASENKFIPVGCLHTGTRISLSDSIYDFKYKPILPTIGNSHRKYSDALARYVTLGRHSVILSNSKLDKIILYYYGFVFDITTRSNIKLLMCNVIHSEDFFNNNISKTEKLNNQLVLISNSIEEYGTLFRNINKDYIIPNKNSMDVLFTNSIESKCLNPIKIESPNAVDLDSYFNNSELNDILARELYG